MVGWNGAKEDKDRKFLSDLKILTTNYCGFSENYLVKKAKEFLESDNDLMFVHIREPFYIQEFLNKFTAAKTLLIKRKDNEFLQALSGITRQSQSTDECLNCSVNSGCAWCTAYNYDHYKTPNKRATFICWMHKARVLANYYYWNKLATVEPNAPEFNLNLSFTC